MMKTEHFQYRFVPLTITKSGGYSMFGLMVEEWFMVKHLIIYVRQSNEIKT